MDRISNNLLALLLIFAMMISALGTSIALQKIESINYYGTGRVSGVVGACISHGPVLNSIGNKNVTQNQQFFYDLNDTQTYHDSEEVYFYENATFFIMNQTTGIINFTATNGMVGEYWVLFWANESICSITDSELINFTVSNVNDAPILDFIPDQTLYEDVPYYYDVNGTDIDLLTPDGDTVKFGDNTTLFIIDTITGEISFTPVQNEVANYSIQIWIYDLQFVDWQDVNFEIVAVNDPPILDFIGAQTATENSTFYFDVNATDEENDTLTFYDNTTLFNINSTSGEITFTPNLSQVNNYSINISVTDGQDWDWELISFTVVRINHAPVIKQWHPSEENSSAAIEISNKTTTIWFYSHRYVNFHVNATDPDGTTLSYIWIVDNVTIAGEVYNNYTFYTTDSAIYTLDVYATDGELNDTHRWIVTILAKPAHIPSGGGGGISGPSGPSCTENWRCTEWSTCRKDGLQTRICIDLGECNTFIRKPEENRTCIYTPYPNCTDNIKNCHHGRCEVMTDCGGPCDPCPTCDDSTKNQGEEGIDCGGPCPPCSAMCIQVLTYAVNLKSGECRSFPSPCDIPDEWKVVDECPPIHPVFILLYIIILAFIATAAALLWLQRRRIINKLRQFWTKLKTIRKGREATLTREEMVGKEALERLEKLKAIRRQEIEEKEQTGKKGQEKEKEEGGE
jgi:hypothetical protein